MIKKLISLVVVMGIGWFAWTTYGPSLFKTPGNGIHLGQTVEEVEKVLGPAKFVSPAFGREERTYRSQDGGKALFIFEDGKLVEMHYSDVP
jgi:hypothetical protein